MTKSARCLLMLLPATLLLANCATYRAHPPARLSLDEVTIAPYVARMTDTSVTIMWETANEMYGWLVLIGDGEPRMLRTGTRGRLHRIDIDGLHPGQAYTYRLAGQHVEYGRFRTFSPEATQYRFATLGDNRTHPDRFAEVANAITRHGVDFTVHSGDILGTGTRHDHWYREWFTPGRDLLLYAPVMIAWGNHEQPDVRASYLHRYYPDRSPFGGEAYYTFRHGPVLFVMLNAYEDFRPGSDQYTWLENTLSERDAPFVVVCLHLAPVTGSAHTMDWNVREFRKWVVPLLVAHEVELVLSGHDHTYTRSQFGDTCFLIAAGGGAPLYPHDRFFNPFAIAATSCTHYVIFDVGPAAVRGTTYAVDGEVIDEFDLPMRAVRARTPAAGIAFEPPAREYAVDSSLAWDVHVRNFTTNWLTGSVEVDLPQGWVVSPGARQTFFLRRDQNALTMPCRAWTKGAAPGRYALTTRVAAGDAHEEMRAVIEVLDDKPVKQLWRMDAAAATVGWSNALNARVEGGAWRAATADDAQAVLFGSCVPVHPTAARDVCFWRMRLSGTNCVTRSRIALHCVTDEGETNTAATHVRVPVNGQWYTHVFAVGRELNWQGRLCGVTLYPALDPNVQIELDEVRVATPPLTPVRN